MAGFIKTTPGGFEKAAVLLGELGPSVSLDILASLNLSTNELHRLRTELQKLGRYNSADINQTMRELNVLEEVKRYGQVKGIYREVARPAAEKKQNEKQKAFTGINPQDIANVLKTWLND